LTKFWLYVTWESNMVETSPFALSQNWELKRYMKHETNSFINQAHIHIAWHARLNFHSNSKKGFSAAGMYFFHNVALLFHIS